MTDLRQVFDDLVRFETILWGVVDGRLQEECGISLASLNGMLVIDATPLCRVHDIAQAVAITVGGASQAVDRPPQDRLEPHQVIKYLPQIGHVASRPRSPSQSSIELISLTLSKLAII